jgi:hypothetical protein
MAGAPLIIVAHNLGYRDTRMVEKYSRRLTVSYASETIWRTAPSFGIVGRTKVVPMVAWRPGLTVTPLFERTDPAFVFAVAEFMWEMSD